MKKFLSKAKWGIYTVVSIFILIAVIISLADSINKPPSIDTDLAEHDEIIEIPEKNQEMLDEMKLAQADTEAERPVRSSSQEPAPVNTNAPLESDENDEMILASNDRPTTSGETDDNYPPVPDFTLKDLNGENFTLSEKLGKLTILNFWATWCKPCLHEIPYFIELYDQYNSQGLEIIGVSVDAGRSKMKLESTVNKYQINYPVLVDGRDVTIHYGGVRSIPTTFIVNEEGKVLGRIVGARPKEFFEELIKKEMLGN